MTRFCDLSKHEQTRQIKHIVTLKSLRALNKPRDLELRNAALVEIESSLGSS